MPAVRPASDAAQGSSGPVVIPLPRFPRPDFLGFFLVAVVVGQSAERRKMLRALVGKPAQEILAVERAPGDAEVGGSQPANAKLDAGIRVATRASRRQRVPARIQIGKKRG